MKYNIKIQQQTTTLSRARTGSTRVQRHVHEVQAKDVEIGMHAFAVRVDERNDEAQHLYNTLNPVLVFSASCPTLSPLNDDLLQSIVNDNPFSA